jgi:hypothetical protein
MKRNHRLHTLSRKHHAVRRGGYSKAPRSSVCTHYGVHRGGWFLAALQGNAVSIAGSEPPILDKPQLLKYDIFGVSRRDQGRNYGVCPESRKR